MKSARSNACDIVVIVRRVVMVLSLVGCGPAVLVDGDGSTTTEASTSTTSTSTTSTSTTSTSTTSTSTTSTSTTSTSTTSTSATTVGDATTGVDDESSEGSPFILNPDGGYCFTHCSECDVWSQDCPDGTKCAPWANDGGDQWNATYCRDLDRNPAQPGESCTIAGTPASGDDDCDLASLCWDVDPQTGVGTCVPFCGGSEANPVCEGDTSCWIANNGVLVLCMPTCDPLVPTCADGLSCVADDDAFFCLPSERVVQDYNAPCEPSLGCGTGLVCAGTGSTPECDASCCTALCDLAAPACPDQGAGQSCVAYFEPGSEPPGLENVGVCLVE